MPISKIFRGFVKLVDFQDLYLQHRRASVTHFSDVHCNSRRETNHAKAYSYSFGDPSARMRMP